MIAKTGSITVEQQGHILLMGINNTDNFNAVTPAMWDDLALAYGRLHRDDELRCGVLWAHGKHFTAGLDLPLWNEKFEDEAFGTLPEGGVDPLGMVTEPCKKPVIGAAQGICITVGIELLLACDIRIAAANTRFSQIEVKRGLYPFGGATTRFQIEAGWGNAMRYILTGDRFNADEAFRLGLVQEVVPSGEQVERALALAQHIARQAPLGVYASLESARQVRHVIEQIAIHDLWPRLQQLLQTEDAAEGVRSFIEKREAQFSGK